MDWDTVNRSKKQVCVTVCMGVAVAVSSRKEDRELGFGRVKIKTLNPTLI